MKNTFAYFPENERESQIILHDFEEHDTTLLPTLDGHAAFFRCRDNDEILTLGIYRLADGFAAAEFRRHDSDSVDCDYDAFQNGQLVPQVFGTARTLAGAWALVKARRYSGDVAGAAINHRIEGMAAIIRFILGNAKVADISSDSREWHTFLDVVRELPLLRELKKCAKNKNLSGVFATAKKIGEIPAMQLLACAFGGRLSADVEKILQHVQMQRSISRSCAGSYGGPKANAIRNFRRFCDYRRLCRLGGYKVVIDIKDGGIVAKIPRIGIERCLGGASMCYAEQRKIMIQLQEIADKLK